MPTLTIKTESIEKLKSLGVYEKWLSNVKAQWGTYEQTQQITSNYRTALYDLLLYAFKWDITPEGNDYWAHLCIENNPFK